MISFTVQVSKAPLTLDAQASLSFLSFNVIRSNQNPRLQTACGAGSAAPAMTARKTPCLRCNAANRDAGLQTPHAQPADTLFYQHESLSSANGLITQIVIQLDIYRQSASWVRGKSIKNVFFSIKYIYPKCHFR